MIYKRISKEYLDYNKYNKNTIRSVTKTYI